MEIRLLGPVEVRSARGPVPIGSAKQRALLAFLALQPRRLVTNDALIDGLWGDDPPDGTVKALRFHVSRLRMILRQADGADALLTRPHGYLLAVAEDAVDVACFESAVAGARSARSEGASPDAVSSALRDALGLWVGPALADVNGEPFVVGERRRLEELRLTTTEDYFAAELAAGRHAETVGDLERIIDRHPMRERFWALLITALYESGRQGDALAAYQRLRRILAEELGIDPSPPLQQLERSVLFQQPVVVLPATSAEAVSPTERPTDAAADEPPSLAEATGRRPAGLAMIALLLGLVALALFWLGGPSMVVALVAVACGAVAASRTTANGRVPWLATAGIVTGVVAFSAGSGLLLYQQVTDDGEPEADAEARGEEPAEGREVGLGSLHVGHCFDMLPTTGPALRETVMLVECEQPHTAEVFHLFQLVPGPYPGEAEVEELAYRQCYTAFERYVGLRPELSQLDFSYVYPGQELWESGDRRGGCALFDRARRDLTGSMLGERR
jgi:DNA-binding SARP family transcriptional activator